MLAYRYSIIELSFWRRFYGVLLRFIGCSYNDKKCTFTCSCDFLCYANEFICLFLIVNKKIR
jgi:hypothetical protein